MNYKFNDAALSKKEINIETTRIILFVVNHNHDILMLNNNGKMEFPYFDVPNNSSNDEELTKLNILLFNKENIIGNIPFISIQDHQYRYRNEDGYNVNRLLKAYCFYVENDNVKIDTAKYTHLFEIQRYIDTHTNDDISNMKSNNKHYDTRILSTILNTYLKENNQFFYDPNYYEYYLKSFFHIREDDNEEMQELRNKTIDMYYGKSYIEKVCRDSRRLLSRLFDYITIINDNYASLNLQYVWGIKNGSGDWYTDICGVYEGNFNDDKVISLFILKNILGDDFQISLNNDYEIIKDDNGNEIGDFIGLPRFLIKGDMNKLLDIVVKEEKEKALSLTKTNN